MQIENATKPKGSEITPYQREIRSALEKIAELEPTANECVSEVALVIGTTKGHDWKTCQSTFRVAMELLQDRGFAKRSYNHWQFRKRFTRSDVDALIVWPGKWRPTGIEASSNR